MKSILGIDIGSSTTKIIEYKNNRIIDKKIIRHFLSENDLEDFFSKKNIKEFEKIVVTGIGASKVDLEKYNIPVIKIEEFDAISKGGLYLSNKEEALVVSVGTGTALIQANKEKSKHIGGTGIGAGTLFNFCDRFLDINNFDEIYELSKKGNIEKIDLRIGDITEKEIDTLPKNLTLSNFGKFDKNAKKEDILIGFINMIFEVIGMMATFATINSDIKDIVLIGNITVLPVVKEILKKIENTHNVKFSVYDDAEYAVALGAVRCVIEENKRR